MQVKPDAHDFKRLVHDTPRVSHCECGVEPPELYESDAWLYRRAAGRHRHHHDAYTNGYKLPKHFPRDALKNGIVRTSDAARPRDPVAQTAHKLVRVGAKPMGYDFGGSAFFSHTGGTQGLPTERNVAYLATSGGRAVAILTAVRTRTWVDYKPGFEGEIPQHMEHSPCVSFVFVAKNARGRGLARKLAEHCAAEDGISLSELVWLTPFSSAGLGFVYDLLDAPNSIRVDR